MVDHHAADILFALHAPRARRDLRDGDAAGVVDVERQGRKLLHGENELVPLRFGELAVADLPHFDFGLLGQNTSRELLRRHFEREEKNRRAARHFRSGLDVLLPHARGVERHVGGERCFAHAGASGEDQKVRRLQAAQQAVDIGEARCHARNPPAARLRFLRQFHRAAQAFAEIDGAAAVFRAFADAVERLFGLFDLRLRRLVVRRFIGVVDDILADADERAAHAQILQDARIVAHVRHGGRGLRQTGEIAVTAHFHQPRIGFHRRVQGQRRDDHAAALGLRGHDLVDALMQRIVEMLRLQRTRHALQRLIVHEDRTEQRLLDFDVIGDVAIGFLFHGALFASVRAAFFAQVGQRINRARAQAASIFPNHAQLNRVPARLIFRGLPRSPQRSSAVYSASTGWKDSIRARRSRCAGEK